MKSIFLAGGFAGFALVTAAGLSAGREPDLVLRDAALACIGGAILLRWFWSVVMKVFGETLVLRRAAAEAQAALHASAKAVPSATPAPAKARSS